MNITACLLHLRNGEEFICGDTYESIQWLSNTPKPTEEEVLSAWEQIKTEEAWKPVRLKRDMLLTQSDWTQLQDSTADKNVWAEYRQALRNIPQTFSDPESIVWPQKP